MTCIYCNDDPKVSKNCYCRIIGDLAAECDCVECNALLTRNTESEQYKNMNGVVVVHHLKGN